MKKKMNEENGFQRFYSVKLKKKLKKINVYKFILMYWKMNEKKYGWIYFWVFPVAGKRIEKKNKEIMKNEKKKNGVQKLAGLLPKLYCNTGYCIVT